MMSNTPATRKNAPTTAAMVTMVNPGANMQKKPAAAKATPAKINPQSCLLALMMRPFPR